MKRNFYFILFVLFILSACSQTLASNQAATAAQAERSAWITSPAPIPTEEGKTVEINSSSYPTNPDNFILNDTRTNEEKMDILLSLAKDDVEKEIELYKEELQRMGKKESDFEFLASIVDGRSWVIVPREKAGGKVYVPSIDGIIQSSLHLFGRLGEKGDFFDLIPVAIENATVVGDSSGWHVVVGVKEGGVSQWYDARFDQVKTIIETTPTPEEKFVELLPPTWEKCLAQNSYQYSEYYRYHSQVVEKVDQIQVNPENYKSFIMLFPQTDTQAEKMPTFINLHINNGEENPIKSCEVYYSENGHLMQQMGITVKRSASSIVRTIYFTRDLTLTNQVREQKGIGEFEISKDYQDMITGNFKEIWINLILSRDYAENGGIWDNLLSLIPSNNTEYLLNVGLLLSWQTIHPETGEMIKLNIEDEISFYDKLKKMILPTTSFWISN